MSGTDANPTSNTNQPEPSFEKQLDAIEPRPLYHHTRWHISPSDKDAILTAHNQAVAQAVRETLERILAVDYIAGRSTSISNHSVVVRHPRMIKDIERELAALEGEQVKGDPK